MVIKMIKTSLICLLALLVVLPLMGCGGSDSSLDSSDPSLTFAENWVKNAATYKFDGIPETFKLSNSMSVAVGTQYVFEFDCQHPGYGDRTGQPLIQRIEHHVVMITIHDEQIISALMDGRWDMIHQRDINPRGT